MEGILGAGTMMVIITAIMPDVEAFDAQKYCRAKTVLLWTAKWTALYADSFDFLKLVPI